MWIIMRTATFLFIVIAHLKTASGDDTHEQKLPNHMTEYLQARDRCIFKKVHLAGRGCKVEVQTCEVEADMVEGSGIYRFNRFGPFTTTGGTQKMTCKAILTDSAIPVGSYLTRTMQAPIEPYSGMLLSYPPIHIHHASMSEKDAYYPPIPSEMIEYLPWLDEDLPFSSSDSCLSATGGPSCLNYVPSGIASKRYKNTTEADVSIILEDVRTINSPPMSTMLEFGSFHVTKPNRALPLPKIALAARFSVDGDEPFFTYPVAYNTESYQVGTFYTAFKIEIIPRTMHLHGYEGDEAWWIRGTQEDLGVPEHLRVEVLWKDAFAQKGAYVYRDPVNMRKGESLEHWKAKFEKNMLHAGMEWESRTKRETRENASKASRPGSKHGAKSYFVPYNEKDPQPMTSKPEILCKYYATVQHVTPEWIAAEEAEFHELMTNNVGHQHFTVEAEPFARVEERRVPFPTYKPSQDKIGPDGYIELPPPNTNEFSTKTVSAREQYRNLFTGVLPGKYYRRPTSALQEKEARYNNCGTFVLEAGDYFTLIGFNAARTNSEFDSTEFYDLPMKSQHTLAPFFVHFSDVPWFY